jgi:DNA-binding NarL/FixJ family response regulator
MDANYQILLVDYDNSIPTPFSNAMTHGYRMKKAKDNTEALSMATSSDVIILMASERRRECIKLMEHVRDAIDPTINFIVILGDQQDNAFLDRIDKLTFQCFNKKNCKLVELAKAIRNAIEMRSLKIREKMFVRDLDRIEDELKKVEHRLYTISTIKRMGTSDATFLN